MSLCPKCGRMYCDHTAKQRGQTPEEMERSVLSREELTVLQCEPADSPEKIRVANIYKHARLGPILLIVKRSWEVPDGKEKGKMGIITAGTHEVEFIDNPFGAESRFLVLKGTMLGQAESTWRRYEGSQWGSFEVVINEENIVL